jgi:hypothetical protein
MTWWLIGGGLLVYIAGSYFLCYRFLKASPGPGGLGWLAFPVAPLMGPFIIWGAFCGLMRRVFR